MAELGYPQEVISSKYTEKTLQKSDDRHPKNIAFMKDSADNEKMKVAPNFEDYDNIPN